PSGRSASASAGKWLFRASWGARTRACSSSSRATHARRPKPAARWTSRTRSRNSATQWGTPKVRILMTTTILPPPKIERVGEIFVVRDDLIPGGTKRRVLAQEIRQFGAAECVYASPAYGYAQIAIAHTCRSLGVQATIFVAKRRELHART